MERSWNNTAKEHCAKENPFFPLFVNLQGRKIVVAGGGIVAARRIKVLYEFGADIYVIAPVISEEIRELEDAVPCVKGSGIHLTERKITKEDIRGAYFVIAATDDKELNNRIGLFCREVRISVNVASNQTLCDFYFPGIVKKGNTVIGITESGHDHKQAKKLRERLDEEIHYHWD